MKKFSLAKSLATIGLATLCVFAVTGCSGESDGDSVTYTGGVAATVNGVEIPEDQVTQAIQDIRAQMGLTDEQTWGEWLAENDYTPESVREEIIDSYIDQELVKQGGESLGITPDAAEVDEYVETMRGHYDSLEAWDEALETVGLTEDEYRENIELSLISQQLRTQVGEEAAEPTDEELLESAQMYVTSYDGAKKSSHILFDSADEAQAQEVLDKINAGELDFATAAETYSQDSGSAEDGGNVGWDRLANFVTEYTDALANLEEGEVSGLVPSTYGIHIIKCTEVFNAPEELTSLDQMPEEFTESIRAIIVSNNESQAYYTWLEEQREAADIVVNDMPEGVPYYVDMANFETDDDDAATTDEDVVMLDADGNPIDVDAAVDAATDEVMDEATEGEAAAESGEEPVAEGVEEGAEGAEEQAADAAAEATAETEQPAEESAE